MASVKNHIRLIWILVFLLSILLAGCSSLYRSLIQRLTPSPSPFWPTETSTVIAGPNSVPFETPAQVVDCAYVWSNRSLPGLSSEINQTFRSQGYPEVEIEATAYGEDCLDPNTNKVVQFSAMQTDFYLNVAIENTNNPSVLGEWVEKILHVLEAFPPGVIPGPNPGYIGINFISGQNTTNLWFPRSKGEGLLREGLRGGELYEALLGSQ